MPADGTSPASKAQTGCRLRQTYKDDLRLSISAPFKENLEGIYKLLHFRVVFSRFRKLPCRITYEE
jgi:hypothetical protein